MQRVEPEANAAREARDAADAREVGRRLGRLRVLAGLSQAEAGRRLGMGQSMVARLEAGERTLGYVEAMRFVDLYGSSLEVIDPDEPFLLPEGGRRRAPARRPTQDPYNRTT